MTSAPFKIRTICAFITLSPLDVTSPLASSPLAAKLKLCADSLIKMQECVPSIEVQTLRIATNTFTEFLDLSDPAAFKAQLAELDAILASLAISFFSLGPCLTAFQTTTFAPLVIHASPRFSVSSLIPPNDATHAAAAAALIVNLSKTTEGGLGNFRYCAQSSSSYGRLSPFFPAGHATSLATSPFTATPGIAFGLENGVLANLGVSKCATLDAIQTTFHDYYAKLLAPPVQAITETCNKLKLEYVGVDTSLNPSLAVGKKAERGCENRRSWRPLSCAALCSHACTHCCATHSCGSHVCICQTAASPPQSSLSPTFTAASAASAPWQRRPRSPRASKRFRTSSRVTAA